MAHLEVLKTEAIYKRVLKNIRNTKFHTSSREALEFMYLLSARCFNNISIIQWEIDHRPTNKEIIEDLRKQAAPLYSDVSHHF